MLPAVRASLAAPAATAGPGRGAPLLPAAALALLLAVAMPGLRAQQAPLPDPASLVSARLVAESSSWHPGQPQTVGLHLRITQGWHVYWKGLNDSGLPLTLELALPPGWSAGPVRWPVPERHVAPGELLDHVYTGAVTLLIAVTPPPGLVPGETATLRARADWLVCREACLKGGADLFVELPVARPGARPVPGPDTALIKSAREHLPGPPPDDLVLARDGTSFTLRVPGATGLTFFPSEEGPLLVDVLHSAVTTGDRLTLGADPRAGTPPPLVGVLAVRRPGVSEPTFHLVDASRTEAPATSPAPPRGGPP